MHKLIERKAMTVSLICSFLLYALTPALAASKKLPVALIAIQFDNISDEVRERIDDRLSNLLISESTMDVSKQTDIDNMITSELPNNGGMGDSLDKLARLADKLKVEHIYGGHLSNNSTDEDRVLLVGEFWRFDRATGLRHTFEVLKYYEDFGLELLRFRNEFVRTVVAERNTGPRILPLLVLAGVAVAGIATFAIVSSEGGTAGGGGQAPVTP